MAYLEEDYERLCDWILEDYPQMYFSRWTKLEILTAN